MANSVSVPAVQFGRRGFCVFLVDLFCRFQTYDKPMVLDKCFRCPHYLRLMRQCDEEDIRLMDEIERIHRHGYSQGELKF